MNSDLLKNLRWFGDSDEIFREHTMPIVTGNGTIRGRLRFKPLEILCVQDCTLQTTYIEGKDFYVEDRDIVFYKQNEEHPYIAEEALYGENMPEEIAEDGKIYGLKCLYSDKPFLTLRQVAVTYRFDVNEWDFDAPKYDKNKIGRFLKKLRNNESPSIILYGDSISAGGNSSKSLKLSPYLPPWYEMMVEKLEYDFNTKINFINISEAGQNATWAIDHIDRMGDKYADLLIIAFGMNDASVRLDIEEYVKNIKRIMDAQKNPECEFVLIGTIIPNKDSGLYNMHREFAKILYRLEDERTTVVDMGAIQEYFLENKIYADMSGNNVNHPNDFLGRIYAMSMLRLFE